MVCETSSFCAQCAANGKTCCQGTEIYITKGDAERIGKYTGKIGYYEFSAPLNPAYLDNADDPLWQLHVLGKDGYRRILKRTPAGDCGFLRPDGCMLPMEVRPLICRLFPFAYTSAGFEERLDTGCPTHLLPPGATVVDVLQLSLSRAQAWHHMLYKEIIIDEKDDRPDIRLAG